MYYYSGHTGKPMRCVRLEDLIAIANRVKRDKEYGAVFKIDPFDKAYVTFSMDLSTQDGQSGGFCLLWSDGRGYKALKPYAYKNPANAFKALRDC